jgi:DNA end-binding protein Ku
MAALEGSLARMGESGGAGAAEQAPGLDRLSKADLLARAADLDIPGRSKMSKPELIEAITAAGEAQPAKRRPRKIS